MPDLKLGAIFPNRDIAVDGAAIRDWTQAAAGLGYDFIEVSDHVLGVERGAVPGFEQLYDIGDAFHETFTTPTANTAGSSPPREHCLATSETRGQSNNVAVRLTTTSTWKHEGRNSRSCRTVRQGTNQGSSSVTSSLPSW